MSEEPDAADDQAPTARQHAFRGGLWIAASNLIPMVGTTVLSVVMGRILGPSELGLQSLIAYVETLTAALLVQAVTNVAIQTLSKSRGAQDEAMFDRLSRMSILANSLGGVLSAVILAIIGSFSDDPLPWMVVALSAFVNGLGWGYGSIAVAKHGWSMVAARRLVSQSAAMVLGILAVVVGYGIAGVFAANVIAATGLLIWLMVLVKRVPRGGIFPLPPGIVALWFGFLVMIALQLIVNSRIEFLFLGALSTDQQIAMYSVPFAIVAAAVLIPTSIIGAGLPGIAESLGAGRLHQTKESFGPALRVTASASLILAAGVAALGPPLLLLLYGEDFKEAAALLPLMAVSLIAAPVGEICFMFWAGVGNLRIPLIGGAIAGAIDVGLALLLIAPLGALGATITNLCAQLAMATLLLVLTRRNIGRFPLGAQRWIMGFAVSLAVGALVTGITHAIGRDSELSALVSLIVGGIVFAIFVVGFGALVGFISAKDAEWLRTTLPGRLRSLVRLFAGPTPQN